jgi:cold shock CspA family protein
MMYERSYGYLMSPTVQDPKAEVWFHESACNGMFRQISPGDEVSFKMTYPPKGPRAVDLRKE